MKSRRDHIRGSGVRQFGGGLMWRRGGPRWLIRERNIQGRRERVGRRQARCERHVQQARVGRDQRKPQPRVAIRRESTGGVLSPKRLGQQGQVFLGERIV